MAKATIGASDIEFTDTDVANAIKDTNQEIFDEAMGDPPDENDGDRSLEEMDDDIPGAEDEAGDEETEDDDETGDIAAQGEEEAEVSEAANDRAADRNLGDMRGPRGGIPSSRLKEEADARRAAEAEARIQQAEARELRARLDALERGQRAPEQRTAAPAKPDMFADPENYEKWVLDQAEQRAAARFEQRQAQRDQERINSSLADAARGPRSFEFQAAYGKLSSLDARDPEAQRTVRGIISSADPAKALFDWWDQNGGEDFRESVRAQLIPNYRPRPQGQQFRANQRGGVNDMQDVRPEVVFRNPKSLNGAAGGGSHRNADPELYNDSEDAVFRYATR